MMVGSTPCDRLAHVFDDRLAPTGQHYRMSSAVLDFEAGDT